MSPHAAAEIDGIRIRRDRITEPETTNHLVVEGAGGILVPLNETETIADLIAPHYKVIVVSRHYLGSINHTLLTVEALKARGFDTGILFSGNEHPTTENIILSKTGAAFLGRISEEEAFNREVIKRYASRFRDRLLSF
jgi:dethiobiotin synthetase